MCLKIKILKLLSHSPGVNELRIMLCAIYGSKDPAIDINQVLIWHFIASGRRLTDVDQSVFHLESMFFLRNWGSEKTKYRQSMASVTWMDKGLKRPTTVWSHRDSSVVEATIRL